MHRFLSPSSRFLPRRLLHSSSALLKIQPFKLADIGEGIAEVEIIQWFVKEGDVVAQFDRVCEVQSDKAAVEISSRFDGVITKRYGEVGDMALVGSTLVDVDTDEVDDAAESAPNSPVAETEKAVEKPTSTIPTPRSSTILTTPAVRRLSREANVDLALVAGSGKDGRILKEDVQSYISGSSQPSTTPAPIVKISENESTVALTSNQRAMFKQMTRSLSIPHFGYSDSLDMTKTLVFRDSINRALKERVDSPVSKISHLAISIKALSLALLDYPILNARVDEGENLTYRERHNIGVAIDTPNGLLVPCIKDVATLSILDIASELVRLRDAATSGKLSMTDLTGTTFSLSNVGNIGGSWLHPVIVSGQVAIGAIGAIRRLPRYVMRDGKEVVEPVQEVAVSFSADHRVIDGATMARFVNVWKGYVEDPARMSARK